MKTVRILSRLAACAALALSVPCALAAAPTLPVPPLRLPAAVERTLPNGLRVVVFTDTRLPIVHMQLLVPAGSAAEANDEAGVASLTVALLRQGTPSRTPEQVTADLAQQGANFATRCARDYAQVACAARVEGFEGTLEVMSDLVINPLFGGEDFASLRINEAMRAGTQQRSFADLASARLAADVFGPHPYAHDPGAGDPRRLAEIELAQLQAFHRDRWRPNRSVLVIAGDVTADRAFAAATDWFGRWEGQVTPDAVRPAPRPATGVHLLDVPGSTRAEVRVGVPGPGLASAGHDAWALAAAAFEGTRLPEGARSELQDARDASVLVLSANVAPEAAAATAKALVAALQACAATPPSGEALATLRRRVAQRFPLTIGTLGAFASQWQVLDFAGEKPGAITGLGARVAAADLGAGLRALAAPPVVLVLGSAASLRAPLAEAGLGTVRVDAISTSTPGAEAESAAPATDEMRRRGKAAVAAAIAAHGGAAALHSVQTLVMEGTITLRMNGEDVAGQFSAVRQDPDRYSLSTKFLTMESRQVCAGGEGWSYFKTDSTVVQTLDSTGVQRLRAAAATDLVHVLRLASAAGANPVWRENELLADRKCDDVEFSTPFGLQRVLIDAETHQVLELSLGQGRRGTWLDRRRLADFRPVNGLLLPFVEERDVRGERAWRIAATSVVANTVVPSVLFARPAGH